MITMQSIAPVLSPPNRRVPPGNGTRPQITSAAGEPDPRVNAFLARLEQLRWWLDRKHAACRRPCAERAGIEDLTRLVKRRGRDGKRRPVAVGRGLPDDAARVGRGAAVGGLVGVKVERIARLWPRFAQILFQPMSYNSRNPPASPAG